MKFRFHLVLIVKKYQYIFDVSTSTDGTAVLPSVWFNLQLYLSIYVMESNHFNLQLDLEI